MLNCATIHILLPAYDEAPSLRRLVPDIGEALEPGRRPFRVWVVDDGSRDRTRPALAELARRWPVQVLSHERNRGYGAALRTGILAILRDGAPEDVVVTMDADNTHPPSRIPALVDKLAEGFDVVTASYSAPGSRAFGVPPLRRALSAGSNLLLRLRYPAPGVRTYTNGFRGWRLSALRGLGSRYGDDLIREEGFPGGAELFLKALAAGLRPAEIPFDLHYEQRGKSSKMDVVRTALLYLRLILGLAASHG